MIPLISGAGALLALIAVVALLSWRAERDPKKGGIMGGDSGSPSNGNDQAACAHNADACSDGGDGGGGGD